MQQQQSKLHYWLSHAEIKIKVFTCMFSYVVARSNGVFFQPKINTFFHDLHCMRHCTTMKALYKINA